MDMRVRSRAPHTLSLLKNVKKGGICVFLSLVKNEIRVFAATVVMLTQTAVSGESESVRADPVRYKCLFNHELMIVALARNDTTAHIQAFIDKLKDTDVDAVMCCPTAWRANLFPSEVDPTWKRYRPDQPPGKFPAWDHIMRYLHAGGDPVRETLEACRKNGKAFFISYRMNDQHLVDDKHWPTHNDFWRGHPEYWLGDTDTSPYSRSDNIRLFNYMHQEVRDHYFAIIKELCDNYDVDGVELDFQRFPRFFYKNEVEQGTQVMTAFVGRIRRMLDETGQGRGKASKLCVRVPETLEKCREAGLDVPGWDASGLIDMINISSFFLHSLKADIETFKTSTSRSRLYGEMNYVIAQTPKYPGTTNVFDQQIAYFRRFTTPEIYRGTALNFLSRGADGISLFNFDYDMPQKTRLVMTKVLKGIADATYLKGASQSYLLSSGYGGLPVKDHAALRVVIPNDARSSVFREAVLRVETRDVCTDVPVEAVFNGTVLAPCVRDDTELFPPVMRNAGYPDADRLKFYAIPLGAFTAGNNEVTVRTLDPKKPPCWFISIEIALYR
jgi:hypothetical protein